MKRSVLLAICLLASLPASGEDKPAPAAEAAVPAVAPAAVPHEAVAPAVTVPAAKVPLLGTTRPIRITGQVVEVRDDVIVVQKGKEKWEIARHPAAQIKGDIKKGARVTVDFRAIAANIEVRDDKK